ncbi:MAG TPA: hypothetical protein VGK42_06020 [Candidatus Dormibacteraeota bacterium]|jgi:hypothetical protein
MKRILLTAGMVLMGMGLVGGAAAALVGETLIPLDKQVGTHTSAAGAVLGIGLMAAAVNPAANIGWVRAGILYGFVVLAFEAGSYFLWRAQFNLGPVIFGLAFSLLLIATYPNRKALVPPTRATPPSPVKPEPSEPAPPESPAPTSTA